MVGALAVEYPDRVVVAVDPAYLLPDETAGAIGPMLDLLADTDPVPFVQRLVRGMDSLALRTWQVRRIAGVAGHVLRQSLAAQATGMALRSRSEPYLCRRCCPVLTFYADPARAEVERGRLHRPPIACGDLGGRRPLAAPGTPGRVQHARHRLAGVDRLVES